MKIIRKEKKNEVLAIRGKIEIIQTTAMICQNTEKSPGDQGMFTMTQTPLKDKDQTLG